MLVIRPATAKDVPVVLALIRARATYEREPDAVLATEADLLRDGVAPEHRKKGAGLALMKALAREAVGRECRRFVWQVLDWNEPSIAFYERLGAQVLRE